MSGQESHAALIDGCANCGQPYTLHNGHDLCPPDRVGTYQPVGGEMGAEKRIEARAECGCTGWIDPAQGVTFVVALNCKEHEPGRRYGVVIRIGDERG